MPRGRASQKTSVRNAPTAQDLLPKAGEQDLKFKLSNGARPAHFLLNSEYIVKGDDGRERTIRYVQGVSSIWKDEQPKDVTRTAIDFVDGDLLVNRFDTSLQEYCLAILKDRGDLSPIKIDDPEAENRHKNALRKAKVKAENLLFDKQESEEGQEELKVVARSYGIEADSLDMETVVSLLQPEAERDPQGFTERFDNPFVKMKSLMFQGLNAGLFDTSDETVVKNSNNGQVVCNVPIGKESVDALTMHALSDKGDVLVEYVETELK